jgi:hypothetical protein
LEQIQDHRRLGAAIKMETELSPNIQYLYANFLSKNVQQYIDLIIPVFGLMDKGLLEVFWGKYKIINDLVPRAVWSDNNPLQRSTR